MSDSCCEGTYQNTNPWEWSINDISFDVLFCFLCVCVGGGGGGGGGCAGNTVQNLHLLNTVRDLHLITILFSFTKLTLCLLGANLASADNICKQFGPRVSFCQVWSGSKQHRFTKLTICLLAANFASAESLCKQFGTRVSFCQVCSGSKPFDDLIVFLKELFEKIYFEQTTTNAWKITQHAKS